LGGSIRLANVTCVYLDAPPHVVLIDTPIKHYSLEPYFYFKDKLSCHVNMVYYFGFTFITNDDETIRTNRINLGIGLRIDLGRNR
jgi:hypothetical protein